MEILPFSWKTLGTRSLQNFIAESLLLSAVLSACPWRQSPIKKWEAHSFYVKKRQNSGWISQKVLCVPFPLQRGRLLRGEAGQRTGHFRSSGEQIWKSIWNEHKTIAWRYWPYIVTVWLSRYSMRWWWWWCGSCRNNAFPLSLREKLQLVPFACYISLCVCVKSLFLQERNMFFVDRPIEQNHILLDD